MQVLLQYRLIIFTNIAQEYLILHHLQYRFLKREGGREEGEGMDGGRLGEGGRGGREVGEGGRGGR